MADLNDWAKKISDKTRKKELEDAHLLEQKVREKKDREERYKYFLSQITPRVERIAGNFAKILGGELSRDHCKCLDDAHAFEIRLRYGKVYISIGKDGRHLVAIHTYDISDSLKRKLKWLHEEDIVYSGKYYEEWAGGYPRTIAFFRLDFSDFEEKKFEKALKAFCESAMGV